MANSSSAVEVIVLGSGTSHGIPMIGCDCAVCTSTDPRDRRLRTSILVRFGGKSFLVDTAPELRLQCLAAKIKQVDAVLFTHHHADHVTGLDDLRRFNWLMDRPVALYGTERTLDAIKRMFLYAFEPAPDSPHSRPELDLHTINGAPFTVQDVPIIPIPLVHGKTPVLGFRFGNFAYCTDCNHIPETSIDLLQNLEVLLLDGLRYTPHPAHFNVDQAVEMARTIGARQTYLTHIAHQIAHQETNRELPEGIALAYDGLRISLPGC